MGRNLVSDTQDRGLFTAGKANPVTIVKGTIEGLFHVLKKDELYTRAKVDGAFTGTMVRVDRKALYKAQQEVLHPKVHPLILIESAMEALEQANRVAEYKTVRNMGQTGEEAAYAARKNLIDFQTGGRMAKQGNRAIPFFNAAIQGTYQFVNKAAKDPVRLLIRGAILTLIGAVNAIINLGNEKYREEPPWRKDTYYCFYPGNKAIYIPKPFEAGMLFASLPERIVEYMASKDPNGFKEWSKSVLDMMTPSYIPAMAIGMFENWANKEVFTGAPIVPMGEENYPPRYQFGRDTSELGKFLG
jgi:hypothetical protein